MGLDAQIFKFDYLHFPFDKDKLGSWIGLKEIDIKILNNKLIFIQVGKAHQEPLHIYFKIILLANHFK